MNLQHPFDEFASQLVKIALECEEWNDRRIATRQVELFLAGLKQAQ